MAKKIIKEMIIMLLLCLAIILLLGVLLYEYVPSNKIIPDEVSYTTPENIKEELSKGDGVDDDKVILTYSVDAADLNNYQRINTYVPGKANPFQEYNQNVETEEGNETNNSSSGNSSTSSSGNTTSSSSSSGTSNSGSTYFPDKGTK